MTKGLYRSAMQGRKIYILPELKLLCRKKTGKTRMNIQEATDAIQKACSIDKAERLITQWLRHGIIGDEDAFTLRGVLYDI